MNTPKLALRFLMHKPLNASLNVLILGLAIASIILLFQINHQATEKFSRQIEGVDLIIGAKGSPMQIVLSSIFHADNPTGNISLLEAEKLASNRMIKQAIPLALGDSYKGFRLVGTESTYFDLFKLHLLKGNHSRHPFEAVIGYELQDVLQLQIGDRFVSQHGLGENAHRHDENEFIVTGVLEKTEMVFDRLIYTSVQSIWDLHASHHHHEGGEHEHHGGAEEHQHDDGHNHWHKRHEETVYSKLIPALPIHNMDSSLQITAMMLQYANPVAAISLPRQINTSGSLMAASPAYELSRMQNILGSGTKLLLYFGYGLLILAGISIFVSQWYRVNDQMIDLAIIRILGKGIMKTSSIWIVQAIYIALCGILLGVFLAHFALFLFNQIDVIGLGIKFNPIEVAKGEPEILMLALLLCLLAILPPLIKSHSRATIDVIKNNQ